MIALRYAYSKNMPGCNMVQAIKSLRNPSKLMHGPKNFGLDNITRSRKAGVKVIRRTVK